MKIENAYAKKPPVGSNEVAAYMSITNATDESISINGIFCFGSKASFSKTGAQRNTYNKPKSNFVPRETTFTKPFVANDFEKRKLAEQRATKRLKGENVQKRKIGSIGKPGPVQPFVQKYIFPGGIIPSLSDMVKPIEKTGLILSDCETLIHHYDKTLKAWLDRFMQNKQKAKYMYNKEFVRMWEFYLASCSAAFKFRDLVVYQLQLVKNFTTLPSNRRNYIYQ